MIEQSPHGNVLFDHLQDAELPRAQPKSRRPNAYGDYNGLVAQGELGDLVDNPRPITPPRRNCDIRDFVGRQADDSMGSMIEQHNCNRSASASRRPTPEHEMIDLSGGAENDADHRPLHGFVLASEIMGLEERTVDPLNRRIKNAPKRRKTSERRALQELDANAATHEISQETTTFDDQDYQPEVTKRTLSRRKSSKKLDRTKSSKVPLERIPPGKGTHDLAFTYSISSNDISRMAGKRHIASSLLGFNEPALSAACGMDLASPHVLSLTASLHGLLVSAGGNGDIAGLAPLLSEVKAAFAQRDEVNNPPLEDEVLMSSGT